MLVLNRRRGEAIQIEGGIRIVILDSDRRGAKVGIEAPDTVRIQREELISPSAAENRKAGAKVDNRAAWAEAFPLKDGDG